MIKEVLATSGDEMTTVSMHMNKDTGARVTTKHISRNRVCGISDYSMTNK
jgi:hypothetical protein